MGNIKATKKFEKNKLKDVLKRRKEGAKIKQRHQMSAKRKERNAKDNERAAPIDGETPKKSKNGEAPETSLNEMSMDQFFAGGFQVPELNKKAKTGKRKRTPVQPESAGSDGVETEEPLSADEAGSESEDDAEAHKEQLAALAEKDPEFYKYLKDNDAELLDFAEDADLAEIDALSASEDESTPRKKKKSAAVEAEAEVGNEVTMKLVEKWRASMESASSLRAMKEVVLAFRAAAHLNEEGGKDYKYSVSESDGVLLFSLSFDTR